VYKYLLNTPTEFEINVQVIFTARRYVIAVGYVLCRCVCLQVCLSEVRVPSKRL